MSFSTFIVGIVIGIFVIPTVLVYPQAALDTGKHIVNTIFQLAEMIK